MCPTTWINSSVVFIDIQSQRLRTKYCQRWGHDISMLRRRFGIGLGLTPQWYDPSALHSGISASAGYLLPDRYGPSAFPSVKPGSAGRPPALQ